jgi:hypothetical protein
MEMNTNQEIQAAFNKDKFVIIKQYLPKDLCLLAYEYCKLRVTRADWLSSTQKENYRAEIDGAWGDKQIPNSYNCYGDPMMEVLLLLTTPLVEKFTGLKLTPQYSYWRFYQTGDILERHTDRGSCEISTTLCLGANHDNVDTNTYPDYKWPMWVVDSEGKEIPAALEPGDLIVYKGCEVEHWRENFQGLNQAQVFLHYNIVGGEFDYKYDGRPCLGLPFTAKDNSKILR